MNNKTFNVDDLINPEKTLVNKLQDVFNRYIFELGVVEGNTFRKESSLKLSQQKGVTNAQLMFIHENGSPARHIPRRPVLDITIQWANSTIIPDFINRCVDNILDGKWSESDIIMNMEKIAIRIQSYARNVIYSNDGRLAPNSKSVADEKLRKAIRNAKTKEQKELAMQSDGNHPLFDTGKLARSITCRVTEIH